MKKNLAIRAFIVAIISVAIILTVSFAVYNSRNQQSTTVVSGTVVNKTRENSITGRNTRYLTIKLENGIVTTVYEKQNSNFLEPINIGDYVVLEVVPTTNGNKVIKCGFDYE